ncbi:transforming growth factor beta like domain protein [Oesophagostomum dentatum]|uniref:Transforming growth factor beta like domain protein n=1 Tax=Oesophagostomum dentatum TaxID=61180 RepID=A0A0B1T0Q6_OESDE|nr:transforming growth factor beta like domain protein [Oesophagostomum dentatum]
MIRALLVVCVSVCLALSTPVSASLALTPHELGMLRKGFLRRFGFPHVPDLSAPALPIPEHVWDIYEEASEDGEIDWIRHYYPKELFELNSGLLVSFNLSASVRNAAAEEVLRAVLKVKLHRTKRPSSISVYEVEEGHPDVRVVKLAKMLPSLSKQNLKLQIRRLLDSKNELFELNSGLLVSFNLSASVRNAAAEEVLRAVLKVKLHRTKRPSSISVYEVEEGHPDIRRLLDSKNVDVPDDPRLTQWIDLDVGPALRAFRTDHDTVTFLIEHPDLIIYASEPHSMSTVPLTRHQSLPLVVYSITKEPSRVRRKRAAPTRRDRKKQRKQHHRHNATDSGICQKKALYVDFEEIGWQEWILAPKSYEAGQCVGKCPHPLPAHLNATNHAIVQSLTNSLNPQVPPPCCVPTETTHLSILFLDVDNK